MSLATQLSNLSTRIGTEFKSVRTSMGSLVSLSTTEKTSLVAAINEVYATVASGGTTTALPAPWTRVDLGGPVAGSKDTWLVP